MGGVMPRRKATKTLRQHMAELSRERAAEEAVRAAKKTLPGEWRAHVRAMIDATRQEITKTTVQRRMFNDVLRHVKPHSTQDGTLRDVVRAFDADLARAQIKLRSLRGLLKLTKACARCHGRGQKFDLRKRQWARDLMRPCSLCRAQGALWVHQ